ncbi:MAG: hypothetical protein L6R36_009416 [Xanthoria steineri]|nr:MAG: hypothetical protein L6R36_009416 [Xanthoria steineri]
MFRGLRRRLLKDDSRNNKSDTSRYLKDGLMGLPVEIRLQIWRELIGGKLCHMIITPSFALKCFPYQEFVKDEWGVTRHRAYSRDGLVSRCQGRVANEACHVSYLQKVPFRTLSLLLTSRSIHSEAIGVLYGSNVFHINMLQTLPAVVRAMGPHVETIKTIHVDLNVRQIPSKNPGSSSESEYNSWIKKWDLFARELSGLQHLRLDIWGCAPHRVFHRSDLEPLLKLRGLQSFRLAIWHLEGDAEAQKLPISDPMEKYFQAQICG